MSKSAKKLVLELEPQGQITFQRTVKIPTPSGVPLDVPFEFIHRSRSEVAAFRAELLAKAPPPPEVPAAAEVVVQALDGEPRVVSATPLAPPVADTTVDDIAAEVAYIMSLAVGWEVDLPFDAKHLALFCQRYAGAALAIGTDYFVSLGQGRLGN